MISLIENIHTELNEMPEDNAFALSAQFYTDPALSTLENQLLLENNWQLLAHTSQLPHPGAQIVSKIGNIPIVLVKTDQHEIKAFHNVCRHRAGPLATKNGQSKTLRCRYHGWTYTLDGALKLAPEMDSTPGFKVCQYHLPEAQVAVWQGLIFVSTGDNPPALSELLDGIADQISPIDISSMMYSHRDEFIIDCNWKVYMDNYLEGYHLPHVHPGLSKLLDYRNYDTKLSKWYSYQFSPLDKAKADSNFYGDGDAYYYCIFPNIMLNILPGRLQTNRVIPHQNKTRVIFDYYYNDIASEKTQQLIKQDKQFSDEIQQEDIDICEQVQQGLNSGSYLVNNTTKKQTGRLCIKREIGVLHFQNLIRQAFRNALENNSIHQNKSSQSS